MSRKAVGPNGVGNLKREALDQELVEVAIGLHASVKSARGSTVDFKSREVIATLVILWSTIMFPGRGRSGNASTSVLAS
jgi:hypothetical protein